MRDGQATGSTDSLEVFERRGGHIGHGVFRQAPQLSLRLVRELLRQAGW